MLKVLTSWWTLSALVQGFRSEWIDSVINSGGGTHYGGFPSYNESLSILKHLSNVNPAYVTPFITGISVECRPLYLFQLSGKGLSNTTTHTIESARLQSNFAFSIMREDGVLVRSCSTSKELPQYQRLWQRFLVKWNDTAQSKIVDTVKDDRGKILITALHHAREPASLTVTLNSFHFLSSHAGNWIAGFNSVSRLDLLCASLLDDRDVFVMPFVNPDGYVAIEAGGDINIRKNRRRTCSKGAPNHLRSEGNEVEAKRQQRYPLTDSDSTPSAVDGVDLNRNYDCFFTVSHSACDKEEYEGPAAFSEPETRAVRRIARYIRPHVAMNFHAYGNLWTRPYNCCPDKRPDKKDQLVFQEIGEELNLTTFGSAPELPILGYAATGEADDYLYREYGVLSMSPEVGPEEGGFYPRSHLVRGINAETLEVILKIIAKAGPALVGTLQRSGDDSVLTLVNRGLQNLPQGALHMRDEAPAYLSVCNEEAQCHWDYIRLSVNFTDMALDDEVVFADITTVVVQSGVPARENITLHLAGHPVEICYQPGQSSQTTLACHCAWFDEMEGEVQRAFIIAPELSSDHPCQSGIWLARQSKTR
eukprot:Blabericola_migrator_1__7696@NODE_392_length_9038_cov_131_832349_g80_i1_p2_GENE_NODE_392_length_9038_cov_131_832349_g80_i1NODE_392_length_9038_cov_131_832349_g80_i1_p2_ORF_typecomplete_len590_score67_26Peptidase_M14/PF00246_24/1_3e41_NODE_392_length_9038_cov_131_832349_g80_i125354304